MLAGLTGFRPAAEFAVEFVTPPYDVIKPGSALEAQLKAKKDSLFHIILGENPAERLQKHLIDGVLVRDDEPCLYVTKQYYGEECRIGFFAAVEVSAYDQKKIIRHEKTFDDKVQGRLELARKTGCTFEPIFLLSKTDINGTLEKICEENAPVYDIKPKFDGGNDLDCVRTMVYRLPFESELAQVLVEVMDSHPLYIADGHHRYHAALLGGQRYCMAYITSDAVIHAYDRVINGVETFDSVKETFELQPIDSFITPDKHAFSIYHAGNAYLLDYKESHMTETDVVKRLDCSLLEKTLYPALGLEHSMVKDIKHFDYFPDFDLEKMKDLVDEGKYDIAVALHPVSVEELMAVADAGLADSEIVMPEKSTYFAPKILSGLIIIENEYNPAEIAE